MVPCAVTKSKTGFAGRLPWQRGLARSGGNWRFGRAGMQGSERGRREFRHGGLPAWEESALWRKLDGASCVSPVVRPEVRPALKALGCGLRCRGGGASEEAFAKC
jgi:hypothetical protein